MQSFSETGLNTPAGQLIARAIILDGVVGLPMELTAFAPKLAPRFTARSGLHAIVDTDCFIVQREQFSIANIATRLTDLHSESYKAFRATVSDFAIDVWK